MSVRGEGGGGGQNRRGDKQELHKKLKNISGDSIKRIYFMNIDGSNTVLSLGQVTYLFGFNVMIVFSNAI